MLNDSSTSSAKLPEEPTDPSDLRLVRLAGALE